MNFKLRSVCPDAMSWFVTCQDFNAPILQEAVKSRYLNESSNEENCTSVGCKANKCYSWSKRSSSRNPWCYISGLSVFKVIHLFLGRWYTSWFRSSINRSRQTRVANDNIHSIERWKCLYRCKHFTRHVTISYVFQRPEKNNMCWVPVVIALWKDPQIEDYLSLCNA